MAKLVMANMREALTYAWRVCNRRIDGDELVSLCYSELMKGAPRFRPGRARFFAFMKAGIRGRLKHYWSTLDAVRNGGTTISIEHLEASEELPEAERPFQRHHLIPASIGPNFDRVFEGERAACINRGMVRSLNAHERMIILLYYRTGLKFIEIGRLLGVSKAAAHVAHRNAIRKLQQYYLDNPREKADVLE